MIPLEKVQLIVKKYETLEKELASGNIDKNDFVKKSKEYSSIGNVINEARSYISFQKEKEELSKIIDEKNGDKAMIELAENELKELVLLRNNLVHHFIDQHDLGSLDGCRSATDEAVAELC